MYFTIFKNAKKTPEKARFELQKNATCYLEEILEAAPHKTAAVGPSAYNLTNPLR